MSQLNWIAELKKWHMKLRLTSSGSELVPKESDWDLLIDEVYPWGDIRFLPSASNSIEVTFPHQAFNFAPLKSWPWRLGNPCLDTDVASLNRADLDIEPTTASHRLLWQVNRLLSWLELAASGSLLAHGDLFELPVFPTIGDQTLRVAFNESAESFEFWKAEFGNSGVCTLFPLLSSKLVTKKDTLLFIRGFKCQNDKAREIEWGNEIENCYSKQRQIVAPWLLLPDLPTIVAWQAPQTWKELVEVCSRHGTELIAILAAYLKDLRQHSPAIILIGMPIPIKYGGPPSQVQWQALKVPPLSPAERVPNGFRNNKVGRSYRDAADIAGILKSRCNWINTENWNKTEITTRGAFSISLQQRKALIIGAGAIGSFLAEGLVRNGIENLLISDGDSLAVGNLTRHTLGLNQIGQLKSQEVARRLNQASPHAKVHVLSGLFPPQSEANIKLVQESQVIVDCTGSDELLVELANFKWGNEKAFFSFSLGLNGRRMFAYFAKSTTFPFETFRAQLRKWLVFEKQTLGIDHPREGTGCWHSVFPARNDDIQIFSASAIKFMEECLLGTTTDEFATFEQMDESGKFYGIRRLSEPEQ